MFYIDDGLFLIGYCCIFLQNLREQKENWNCCEAQMTEQHIPHEGMEVDYDSDATEVLDFTEEYIDDGENVAVNWIVE